MYYWQKDPDLKPIKAQIPIGEIYLKGYADGYYGRQAKKPRGRRAQEEYIKGYNFGVQSGSANLDRVSS